MKISLLFNFSIFEYNKKLQFYVAFYLFDKIEASPLQYTIFYQPLLSYHSFESKNRCSSP